MSNRSDDAFIIIGRFGSSYGFKGWVKITPETQTLDSMLQYDPWYIETKQGWERIQRTGARIHGKGIIAHIEGYDSKEVTPALTGKLIAIEKSQLPELDDDEFYWSEIEGMNVVTTEQVELGQVSHLMEVGLKDVLVIQGKQKHLIPFIWDKFIKEVNRETKTITVDWDPDF